MTDLVSLNKYTEEISKREKIIGELRHQLTERDKSILILRVRSRIEELEKRFLQPNMMKETRYQKWIRILTADSLSLREREELVRFRNTVTISHEEFIKTICRLYAGFNDLAAHGVNYPVPYDEIAITQMLRNFRITPNRSKIDAIVILLTPIP